MIPMGDHWEAGHVGEALFVGGVWRRPPGKKGAQLLGGMVRQRSVCLRRLARGRRREIVGYHRFLSNKQVSVERLIEAWGEPTALMCAGRHVLAIQDTSEVKFQTGMENRRGLGLAGKGNCYGLLLHAMLAVDAETGGCLGLVSGRIWTRDGVAVVPHAKRRLADKESERWLTTAQEAKAVLDEAACVTVVADRESDIYAEWARLPETNFHLLTRALKDRRTVGGGRLSTAELSPAGETLAEIAARPGRAARKATLTARFGPVEIARPSNTIEPDMPKSVALHLVEVVELDPPAGAEPISWRLLTTHRLETCEDAWRIVGWYRRRWAIEQFFRTLKQQGLDLEASQVDSAERLLKLTAIAARAACTIMQLVHARDGKSAQPATIAFTPPEIEVLQALVPELEGVTAAQKNPHPRHSLAWAAWVIAKPGGWDGYKSSKPPGPITFANGLQDFRAIAQGWSLRDV